MFRFILYFLAFYFIVESFRPTGTDLMLPGGSYHCHYARLWCGCYSGGGGCEVGCSPSYVKTLYNQTNCPILQDHYLAGFN